MPHSFLSLVASDFSLSSSTIDIFTNINGMGLARDQCATIADEKLTGNLMSKPELASFGDSPVQGGTCEGLAALRDQASEAKIVLDSSLTAGLLNLGVDPKKVIEVTRQGSSTPKSFPVYTGAPLKTVESCTRKMVNDYSNKHLRLCDIVRCSVVVDTEEQLSALLSAFINNEIAGITPVRLKNRFANPMFTGIRDCLMNVNIKCPDGSSHIGEVQLHFAPILALKGLCHVYYEFFREFFAGADSSYQMRLEMFEKLGIIIQPDQTVEEAIVAILKGDDMERLQALAEITSNHVLGDSKLCLSATKKLATVILNEEGEESSEFSKLLTRVANCYRDRGHLDTAKEVYKAISDIETRVMGKLSNSTKDDLIIGEMMIMNVQSNYMFGTALDGYEVKKQQALNEERLQSSDELEKKKSIHDEVKKVSGEIHPETLTALNDVALEYYKIGDYSNALDLYNKCLDGRVSVLVEQHPDTVQTYLMTGHCYKALGELDMAKTVFDEWSALTNNKSPFDELGVISAQASMQAEEIEGALLAFSMK
jgi:tetratricopeptide (TPR) repeat protein